jgi:sialic acid synthase SpsE
MIKDSQLKEQLKTVPPHIMLGADKVGRGLPTYFIAEIGNNHNGDFYLAKRSIEEAAKAGAHAVKFQKRFIKETFASELRDKPQTKQEIAGSTYGEYREGLELSLKEFIELKEVARLNGVAFFATPFDKASVDFLEEVDIPFYKVASFDLTNLPLLDYIAKLKKPIILSTGMATAEEIEEAVSTIFKHHKDLVLLHCVSVYPSPDQYVNLGAMEELHKHYAPLAVGYSGHESDILASVVAIARGACVIERHFTLSRLLPGPDHGTVSLEPDDFAEMVETSNRIQAMYGSGKKELLAEEKGSREKHSKSIVSAVKISKGTVITEEMLTCKSPGYGLKPRDLPLVVGKTAEVDIEEDIVIDLKYLSSIS